MYRPCVAHILHYDGAEVFPATAGIFPCEHGDVDLPVGSNSNARNRAAEVVGVSVVEGCLEVGKFIFAKEFPRVAVKLEYVTLGERGLALVVDDGVQLVVEGGEADMVGQDAFEMDLANTPEESQLTSEVFTLPL